MNEFEYELKLEIELNSDDNNTVYRYYNTYEEALNDFNILKDFVTYANVSIKIFKNENVLKEVILTNGENE